MKDWKNVDDSQMVCYCKEVTKGVIVRSILAGNTTLTAVRDATGACTGDRCSELNPTGECCADSIREIIQVYTGKDPGKPEKSCCCCH